MNLFTIKEKNRIWIQLADQALSTIQILCLFNSKSSNASIRLRRWVHGSVLLLHSFEHREETNIGLDDTSILSVAKYFQLQILMLRDRFQLIQWECRSAKLFILAKFIPVVYLKRKRISKGGDDDMQCVIPTRIGVPFDRFSLAKRVAAIQ